MAQAELKALWQALEQATTLLQKNLHTSFLDAVIEAGEDLQLGIRHEDGLPDAATTAKLKELFAPINLRDYTPEELRQALQLVLVKAITVDGIQPNQQVTPDAMASLASFMVTTFMPHFSSAATIVDPTAGTGNLLFAVMNQLHTATGSTLHGVGIDNDEQLLGVASMSAALQGLDVELLHQDALANLPVTAATLVVADLPVGFYPVDERAKQFATAAKSGHSYAHHLLIEQSVRMLAPGGLGLFFVPSDLFQTEEAAGLTAWLTQAALFQGLLNLPKGFFTSATAQKALLVVQKPGGSAKQVKQVLLGEFPDLNDRAAFAQFVDSVHSWAAQNLA